MNPQRISLKYFVQDPAAVDLAAFVPVFHRWIQNRVVGGLLIDVADYKHMHRGPGIVLIGHEGDYALDMGGGRPGLLYRSKRSMNGDLCERVRAVFRLALLACQALEVEPALEGRIAFRTDRAELAFPDRLRAPNHPDTFDALRGEVQAVLEELYGEATVQLRPINGDARPAFVLGIRASGAPDLSTLVGRLETTASDQTPSRERVSR